MNWPMDWGLSFVNLNTIWITIVFLLIGYLFGTIIIARIYISLFKNGDATFINGQGKTEVISRFGTSYMAKAFGIKFGIMVFMVDFFKGFLGFYIFIYPLMLFIPIFSSAIAGVYLIGLIIGNNFPCWWKWKGGIGVATCLGGFYAINPVSATIGFASWLLVTIKTKNSGLGGITGTTIATIMLFIPYIVMVGNYWYLDEYTANAGTAYCVLVVLGIMCISQRYIFSSFKIIFPFKKMKDKFVNKYISFT